MLEAMEARESLTQEAFRLRMESQCTRIKSYRIAVLRDSGRALSPDEAAREWIERYAASFDGLSVIE
jgi:hypothetical protein